nr:immunoglobulin light chain junction region [Macaca mulatta]MOW71718.1 immunoglobulin light chain junction region [Macaca mulatta]MOW72304.1 immunoglobulin light chain junction region [Macaca mulatta]
DYYCYSSDSSVNLF